MLADLERRVRKDMKRPLKYKGGALRLTRTPGRHGAKNAVSLDNLIHPNELCAAFVFSFFIDNDLLFPVCALMSLSAFLHASSISLLRRGFAPLPAPKLTCMSVVIFP